MSSQKIGPNSLASRVRSCTGALESSDSMLPTTGLVGGCGIGLNRLFGAILGFVPSASLRAKRSNPDFLCGPGLLRGACHRARIRATRWLAMTNFLPKPPSTPFDQLGADLLGLFLLRPMAAAAHEIFLQ